MARLQTEPVSYGLQHWGCYDPSHAPHSVSPEGQIGMMEPAGGGWYFNGFFNFSVDDQPGNTYPLQALRVLDKGPRGSVEFVWDLPAAVVRVRFLVIPGQRPLYCSIAMSPKTDRVPVLKVRLVAYPSGYFNDGQRVATGPVRTLKTPSKTALDPAKETWLALYDEKYDAGVLGGSGGCGAAVLPQGVGQSSVELSSYPAVWELQSAPGATELRLAFWNGLGLKNAELVPCLKSECDAALKTLAALDFRPQRLQESFLAPLKAEYEKMLAETPDSQADRRQYEAALAKLTDLRQRATAPQPDLQAEEDYFKAADGLEQALWQLRMKWVFAD